MKKDKIIETETIQKLEDSKNEALKRIAERLREQASNDYAEASHSSHSAGAGRTHSSQVHA